MKNSDFSKENENNDIINITDINNIKIRSNELDYNNKNIKPILNHSIIIKNVIDNFLKNSKEMHIQSEYKINLLLMSTLNNNNNICIKCLYYNLIFQFNIIKKNIPIIKYIINKMNNLYEKNKEINIKIFIKMLYSYAQILYEQKHYFYCYYCLRKAKNIVGGIKFEKELESVNSLYFKDLENINAYIKSKYDLFKNRNNLSENKLIIIGKILDEILKEKKNIKNDIIDEINNNKKEGKDSYLYFIAHNWISKANKFINNLNNSLKIGKEKNFFENSFNEDYVLYSYFNEINYNKKEDNYHYPGPINNYYLLQYKDSWEDPKSVEENIFIQNNFKLNNDYYFITENKWNILKDIFDCTNEIKIKNNKVEEDDELISLKPLILEKRLRKNLLHNLLRLRVIQIKNNYNIKQLKEKIIRCISYEFKKIKEEKLVFFGKDNEEEMKELNEQLYQKLNIYFFLIPKNYKNILIEICTAFINRMKIYNSTLIKEVNLKEDDSIKELLKIYNKKENILIIEINENSFLREIKPKSKDFVFACDICNNQLTENEKYICGKCNISFLCSEKCYKKSKIHTDFHNYFFPLLKPHFNLKILYQKNMIFNDNSRKGNVVLNNLGNTCYLNSTIHCLSNTIDLSKYFIFDIHKDEQNFIKYNSSSGNIIEEYALLIKQLWIGKEKIISPEKFRTAFCKTTSNFLGNVKYPPYDFLECLLSTFHELLNRAFLYSNISKKEEEINVKENIFEKNKIYEYNDRLKNDSIIYDLFNGHIITTKICQICKKNTSFFENFKILNLPVPKNHCSFSIKYFNEKEYKSFPFSINEKSTFGDLKEKALSYYKNELIQKIIKNNEDIFSKTMYIDNSDESNLLNYEGYKIPKIILYEYLDIIILNSKKIIINNRKIKNKEKILSYLDNKEKEYEITLYEKATLSDKYANIYVSATNFEDKKNIKINIFKKEKLDIYSYPTLLNVEKNLFLINIKQIIKDKYNKIINIQKNGDGIKNNNIQILIVHFKDGPLCNFCRKEYKDSKYCFLDDIINRNSIVSDLNNKNDEAIIFLGINSKNYSVDKKFKDKNILFINPNEESNIENNYVNLFDCLEKFREETIIENKGLFCEKCKMETKFKIKNQLFKTPLYLIVNLKKGEYKNNENTENNTKISLTETLDLKEYLIGIDKENSIYELYGIILYIQGHYAAYCKKKEKWILFDDGNTSISSFPQNKKSNLLFYKKKIL